MLIDFKRGQGSIVLRVKILDSGVATGAGKTGLSSASSGLIIAAIADNEATTTAHTVAGSNVESITTLGTFAAPTGGKCRFKEVDATNHKGVYEIQLADARYAVSGAKSLLISISGAAGAADCDVCIPLRDVDPYDAAKFGMSNLDAAVSSRLASVSYTAPDNATIAAIAGYVDTEIAAIKAKTDNLPPNPAASGEAMTLTVSERDAISATLFASVIESSETFIETVRLVRAALLGKTDGFPDGPVHFRDAADSRNRITASVDAAGNRTSLVTDAS